MQDGIKMFLAEVRARRKFWKRARCQWFTLYAVNCSWLLVFAVKAGAHIGTSSWWAILDVAVAILMLDGIRTSYIWIHRSKRIMRALIDEVQTVREKMRFYRRLARMNRPLMIVSSTTKLDLKP